MYWMTVKAKVLLVTFHWFFIDFHWFSFIFYWISIDSHDFHDLYWFSHDFLTIPTFKQCSLIFIDFHSFSIDFLVQCTNCLTILTFKCLNNHKSWSNLFTNFFWNHEFPHFCTFTWFSHHNACCQTSSAKSHYTTK